MRTSTGATRSPRRRTALALAVVFAVMVGFLIRLVDIQVVNADQHVEESLAISNVGTTKDIDGVRGSIVDTNGDVLAESALVYDAHLDVRALFAVENDEDNPPDMPWAEASEKIAQIVGMSGDEIRAIAAEDPESQYAPLVRGLSTQQYVALRDLSLDYLWATPRSVREYPNGAVAGNILGFVDTDSQPLAGLEQTETACLTPTKGHKSYLSGADGTMVPGSLREVPAVDGGTVTLTINSELQWYLQQMLAEETQTQGAQGATALVVEVKTGKIRAAAEYPSVDPNDPGASDPEDRGARLFSTTFEPGSTFKAITAAAVMEGAGATALTSVVAASHEEFPNGAVINDAVSHPTYEYTLAGALIDSSNVALSKFGEMVDPQVRYDYLEKFGVGSPTDIDFPGEGGSVLHPVSEWDAQSLYTTTFGQYYTVTVPHVASAYQAIANGGVRMPLSLVESCTDAEGTVSENKAGKPERIIQESTATELSRMIENVAVQGDLSEDIYIPGYRVAAKTGTAEKPDGNGGYKPGLYFTSMVGFAPVDDPEYVVVVTLDEPTRVTSSAATAPAFQKAMTQALKTFRVMPSDVPMEEPLPKYK